MLRSPGRLQTVALLGGSGFVGRTLAAHLESAGIAVRLFTRAAAHAREAWLLPHTRCVVGPLANGEALAREFADCDAVVNLVGILNERRDDGAGFRAAHLTVTERALAAARAAGVPRYVQVSALNADPAGPSHYLRSKGEAEAKVLAAAGLRTAIVRPSVIFGAGDELFGRFHTLVRWLPCLPLAGAGARMQPVFVGDVVEAILRILKDDRLASGRIFELGGPEVMTLQAIVEYTARHARHFCPVIPLPDWAGRLQAEICEHLPGKPFSRDNWRSLQRDSVVQGEDGLAALGIEATPVAAVVPQLLDPTRRARDYQHRRRTAGR